MSETVDVARPTPGCGCQTCARLTELSRLATPPASETWRASYDGERGPIGKAYDKAASETVDAAALDAAPEDADAPD